MNTFNRDGVGRDEETLLTGTEWGGGDRKILTGRRIPSRDGVEISDRSILAAKGLGVVTEVSCQG